jgi:hypothetical protein
MDNCKQIEVVAAQRHHSSLHAAACRDVRVPGPAYSPSWQGCGVSKAQLMLAEGVARAFLEIYKFDRNVVVEDIVLRPLVGHIASN